MEMNDWASILIICHAAAGFLALGSGMLAIIGKKGQNLHRKAGKVFHLSMLFSVVVALIVSVTPNHTNLFLLGIGTMSLYFVISGKRALRLKRKDADIRIDRIIATTAIVAGAAMITYPFYLFRSINVILIVFGTLTMFFGVRDWISLSQPEKWRKLWLPSHIGKMTGGYISATTAFVVVNELLPWYAAWFGPSIPGTIFIFYWIKKVTRK